MCLAIPMEVVEIDDAGKATVDVDGVRQAADLSLIENPKVGDYVLVHAGFAIERLDEEEAAKTLELFRELDEVNAVP